MGKELKNVCVCRQARFSWIALEVGLRGLLTVEVSHCDQKAFNLCCDNLAAPLLSCCSISEEGQWGWWRLWSTDLIRSGWGSCGCLTWRRGGSGGTWSFSAAAWEERVARWGGLVSYLKEEVTGKEETASSCSRGGLDWILEVKVVHWKSCQAQAAQGSGRVSILEVFERM